jgi:hypothetical protein
MCSWVRRVSFRDSSGRRAGHLIDSRTRVLDRVLPFGALACQEGIELLGRSGTDIDAALCEAFAHVRRLYGAIDLRVQARDDGFRRAGGHEDTVEDVVVEVPKARLDQRRHDGQGREPLRRRRCQRPQLAAFDRG